MNRTALGYLALSSVVLLNGCNIEPRDSSPVTADRTLTTGNSNSNSDSSGNLSCSLEDQKTALVNIMLSQTQAQSTSSTLGMYYLNAVNVDPDAYSSLSELLIAMRDPQDRWSYVDQGPSGGPSSGLQSTSSYTNTFGFRWTYSGGQVRIAYVFPNSPAQTAGIARGNIITQINGQPVTSDSQFASALNNSSVNLQISGGGTVTVSRANFSSPDITDIQTFTLGNGDKVGYFYLDNFNNFIDGEYASTFGALKAQNIDSLVIDLRYNGGGLIYSAYQLAHMIVGNTKNGLVFNNILFNAQHTSKNEQLDFNLSQFSSQLQSNALSLSKVVFLTGNQTASASELLIKGLEPHISVSVIGEQTNGKPYGMQGVTICDSTVWPLSFLNQNSNLQTTPLNGIPPTCTVNDDYSQPLGSSSEPLLNKALSYLNTGSC